MADQGHANNVANFEQLVSICTGLGGQYDPGNVDIKVTNLETKLSGTTGAWDGYGTAKASETMADTNRENGFKTLGPTATASVNYYQSTDAPDNRIKDAKEFLRKLRGRRATPLVDDPETPEDESQGGNQVAQTSYVQRVEHLDGLIDLFTADAMYSPNEMPVKVVTLTALSDTLKDLNTASFNANTTTASSRTSFFAEAYVGDNNMIDLAMQVKKYLKALLGPSNIIYKQAAALKFTRPKA